MAKLYEEFLVRAVEDESGFVEPQYYALRTLSLEAGALDASIDPLVG